VAPEPGSGPSADQAHGGAHHGGRVGDGRDLTARASVIHAGRTIAVTQAAIENADRKPVALATGSSMYLPGRPAALGELELPGGRGDD
jgi:hypothetical protein